MQKKTVILPVLLMITYLTMVNSECNKRLNCSQVTYSFEINSKAIPDNDSIFVNDTIWIEVTCSTNLVDKISQTTINYSGAENLGTVIRCHEFIGGDILNPGAVGAANDFNFIIIYGSLIPSPINPNTNREFSFSEIQGTYRFKVGVIPTKRGVFSLAVLDAANVYTKSNKCNKAGFSITFANTNLHLYFYEQNRPGYIPSQYERTHMYCFKVK